MKKTNNSNLIEENERYKQKAQLLTSNKNYRGVIKCYEKIAKNIKIEKKSEKDEKSKFLLKSKLKQIKKLIKNLRIIVNKLNETFSIDRYYFFKDFQDSHYLFEQLDLNDDVYIGYDDICQTREDEISSPQEETPKKNCYKCKCKITLYELKIANPSMDGAYLQKLFESPFIEFYCCDCFEIKSPDLIVRDSIRYLILLEKNIRYPLKKVWNYKISGYQEVELRQYLEQIIRIKNNKPNDLTQDANLISLVKEFIPDFIIEDSI